MLYFAQEAVFVGKNMKTKELIQRLRDKDDQLCSLAADELEKLLRR